MTENTTSPQIDKDPEILGVKIRNANMKKTQGFDESMDLKNPFNIAKVALMPNDTHPNLIGETVDVLKAHGISQERIDIYLNHFLLKAAVGTSLLSQRTAVVSFWRSQMMHLGEKAYTARGALEAMASTVITRDIVDLFSNLPMDMIQRYNLPYAGMAPALVQEG